MENKLVFIEVSDPEIQRAFKVVSPNDPVMYNETYREVLQYMGTVIEPSGRICHEFRHRALPGTNERKYWQITASNEFINRFKRNEELQARCF